MNSQKQKNKNLSHSIHVWYTVYLPTFSIKINHPCRYSKSTIVPWMVGLEANTGEAFFDAGEMNSSSLGCGELGESYPSRRGRDQKLRYQGFEVSNHPQKEMNKHDFRGGKIGGSWEKNKKLLVFFIGLWCGFCCSPCFFQECSASTQTPGKKSGRGVPKFDTKKQSKNFPLFFVGI